jgi:hypothetical protein
MLNAHSAVEGREFARRHAMFSGDHLQSIETFLNPVSALRVHVYVITVAT